MMSDERFVDKGSLNLKCKTYKGFLTGTLNYLVFTDFKLTQDELISLKLTQDDLVFYFY